MLALGAATKTNIPMKTETMSRMSTDFDEKSLFRRRKHEFVKAECEEIEMHGSRNNAQKFFQKIKRMSDEFKPGAL